ncbi:MAG TPA: PHP domain-containing protein [Caldithrix abyssi]|uniref:PHP domain-containing protein n=1 Tax=Caldithrix abyssi TaxID=187145 RepID=A0A7V4U2S5_CALAY|nr:PHP domain-containing protein [Caldithrix abyssi]
MFKRFNDLTEDDINCDLQIHTNRTDGQAGIEEIVNRARQIGLKRIAFTEHVRKDTDWFNEFADEIEEVRRRTGGIEIYIGCETKILNVHGTLDVSERILDRCEIILGSVHRFPDGAGGYLDFTWITEDDFSRMEFELASALLLYAPIDVLAHPGGMYARHHGNFPQNLLAELLELSKKRNVAVELNASYLKDIKTVLPVYREINPYVSIGSDVHRLEELGLCRDSLRLLGVGRS